ncbi:MAG: methionine synthase [Stackebrandtia sp.]
MPEVAPLPTGTATGVGSLPGNGREPLYGRSSHVVGQTTAVAEAVRTVFGELPDFPHLPELPGRGAGADMIGRSAALLVDLPVELYAGRWQLTARPGRDFRLARDFLARDLDALDKEAGDHDGPVKIASAGPWTLSTALHRQLGGPMLRDPGAVRELAASLAEGLAAHVAEVCARLPRAAVTLQLDEPSLPAVLAGDIPTESGFSRYRAVEEDTARQGLASIVEAVDVPVIVHCCAPETPVSTIRSTGASGASLDLSLIDMDAAAGLDPLGEALDAGFVLMAGAVPATGDDDAAPSGREAAELIDRLWSRLGLPAESRRDQVIVSPACGLAGASPEYARAAMAACREAARRVSE